MMTDIERRNILTNHGKTETERHAEAVRCYELRLSGLSEYQIAEQLGISQSTVSRRLQEERTNRIAPLAEEYRTLLIDRLEQQYQRQNAIAERGGDQELPASQAAAATVLKMFEVSGLKSIDAPPPSILVVDQATSEAAQKMREENERRLAMIRGSIPGQIVTESDNQPEITDQLSDSNSDSV